MDDSSLNQLDKARSLIEKLEEEFQESWNDSIGDQFKDKYLHRLVEEISNLKGKLQEYVAICEEMKQLYSDIDYEVGSI